MFPEFSRHFLQQGNRLPASMPLPSSCVCKPPLELIPAGSKVLRAVFRGGVTGASSDLKLSGCSALSGSSRRAADVPLDSFAETTQGGPVLPRTLGFRVALNFWVLLDEPLMCLSRLLPQVRPRTLCFRVARDLWVLLEVPLMYLLCLQPRNSPRLLIRR